MYEALAHLIRMHEVRDVAYISADYGLKEWSDPFYFHMYKYALNVKAIPYLSFNVANIIKSVFGKNKKGFVLDLDNTLWGGVIGDDGVEGIKVGPEEPEGQFYAEFQRYLKEHKQLGVILNIDSKNEYENAIAGLKHPDSELSEDDFIEIKANWEPKDRNFEAIARELDLLPESLVFVDDNPAERHIVTEQLKGVSAPELDVTQHFIQYIDRNGFFEVTTLSKDDLKRNEMYKENMERIKAQASFSDYKDYLLSLQMKAVIKGFHTANHNACIADSSYFYCCTAVTCRSGSCCIHITCCNAHYIISDSLIYFNISRRIINRRNCKLTACNKCIYCISLCKIISSSLTCTCQDSRITCKEIS